MYQELVSALLVIVASYLIMSESRGGRERRRQGMAQGYDDPYQAQGDGYFGAPGRRPRHIMVSRVENPFGAGERLKTRDKMRREVGEIYENGDLPVEERFGQRRVIDRREFG
jgi:hypothetical protein